MKTEIASPRVFISFSVAQKGLAESIRKSLTSAGVEIAGMDVPPGGAAQRALMKAIASSDAVVVALPDRLPVAAMIGIEVGAAQAWGKPVFAVTEFAGHIELPGYVASSNVFPISRVDDLVDRVQKVASGFSDEERQWLVEVYREMGAPTDELMLAPVRLDEFASRFAKLSGSERPSERLLRELITLRKQGRLPKLAANRARDAN